MRCENTAAIILTTGEGSWKTKSAAIKVAFIKEQVEHGLMKIKYVSTKLQAAVSLTKFLRSGQDQQSVLELFGLEDIHDLVYCAVPFANSFLNILRIFSITTYNVTQIFNFTHFGHFMTMYTWSGTIGTVFSHMHCYALICVELKFL